MADQPSLEQARWRLLAYIDGETDYKTDGRPEVALFEAAVRAEVIREVEALMQFASHREGCNDPSGCLCGFAAAVRSLSGREGKA